MRIQVYDLKRFQIDCTVSITLLVIVDNLKKDLNTRKIP